MAVLIVFPSDSQTSVGKLKTSSKHTFFPITRRDHHPDDIVKPAVPVYFTVRSPSTLVYIFLSDIVLLTRLINTVKETSKDRHTTMDYVMRTPLSLHSNTALCTYIFRSDADNESMLSDRTSSVRSESSVPSSSV